MEHEQWEEPLSAAMWLAYYALVFWGIQKLFSKMGSWWRGAGKKEEEEEPPIVDVSLEQLGNKKVGGECMCGWIDCGFGVRFCLIGWSSEEKKNDRWR